MSTRTIEACMWFFDVVDRWSREPPRPAWDRWSTWCLVACAFVAGGVL